MGEKSWAAGGAGKREEEEEEPTDGGGCRLFGGGGSGSLTGALWTARAGRWWCATTAPG